MLSLVLQASRFYVGNAIATGGFSGDALFSFSIFTARAYARAVLGVVILSVRPSVTRVHCDTRAHHRDEKPERDLTYHLTCLLIYR